MHPFRFGIALRALGNQAEWAAKCRRAEELGYRAITVPDHLGALSPFPALAVAATVTERVRVGPLVLNAPFHNPALLARDAASTDLLSGGRLELGLGSGHAKAEFDEAGLPWQPAARRIEYLERTVLELRRRLSGEHEPPVVQRPHPPLLIAGNSDGVLALAAEHAAIAGFAGLRQAPGEPPGTFTLATAEELDERVAFFAGKADERDASIERNMLIQHVAVTEDRPAAAQQWAEALGRFSGPELLELPQVLIGTVEQIVERVRAMRERFGFSYLTVMEPALEAFAPVVRALDGT